MGSRLFIDLTSPGRNTIGLGLFFELMSPRKTLGSSFALSGSPLEIPTRGCSR
jgi:hypothetical protein